MNGFNPKARWGRHIPETEDQSPELLSERIDALVYFKNAKIYPRVFYWKSRLYKIRKITYAWQERRGQEMLNLFTVSTGADLYQISFNNTTYSWRVDKVIE